MIGYPEFIERWPLSGRETPLSFEIAESDAGKGGSDEYLQYAV